MLVMAALLQEIATNRTAMTVGDARVGALDSSREGEVPVPAPSARAHALRRRTAGVRPRADLIRPSFMQDVEEAFHGNQEFNFGWSSIAAPAQGKSRSGDRDRGHFIHRRRSRTDLALARCGRTWECVSAGRACRRALAPPYGHCARLGEMAPASADRSSATG